ncbi:MAG: matrixin family metalloprotease [Myxococcus sp.]|nr:matrixin family metalloprotease [Myxococcus sp.]
MRSLLVPLVLAPLMASAFELRTDTQGDVVRWRRAVVFVVDPSLGAVLSEPSALAAVKRAIVELDEATPRLDVSVVEGAVRGPGFLLDEGATNQNEILALADWPYTDGALASTVVTVNARTDEILDTDIVFNAEQHTFRVLPAAVPGPDLDDVQNTVTHELGHALGLMHNAHDARVVMYPRASAGETGKRVLQEDDRDGLSVLYSDAVVTPQVLREQQMGCASAPGTGGWLLAALAFMTLLMGRRSARVLVRVPLQSSVGRGLGLLVGVVGAAAWAQPVAPIGVGVVRAKVAHRAPSSPGLIVTSLELDLEACASASACERVIRVTVPGGRLGDLEQVVEHHPVPALQERLGLATRNGRVVVFRLAEASEAQRFQELLVKSAAPQPSAQPPGRAAQPVGSSK